MPSKKPPATYTTAPLEVEEDPLRLSRQRQLIVRLGAERWSQRTKMPHHLELVSTITLPILFGEVAFTLWLLIVGARERRRQTMLAAST